jgi:hypothetical protein
MAKSDWTIVTDGSWAVIDAEYVSSSHSMKAVSGWSRFKYAESLLDVRVVGSTKVKSSLSGNVHYGGEFLARIGSISAPLQFYLGAVRAYDTNRYAISFVRYKAGVYTLLAGNQYFAIYPSGSGFTAWHKWRFSVTDELSMSVLRMDYYNTNTASWGNAYTYDDDTVNRLTVAGDSGFGVYAPAGSDDKVFMDDISVISLTS